MQSDRLKRVRQFARDRRRLSALPHRSAVTKLRFAFFALASDSAMRYSVRFERVLRHLWEGRRFNRRFLVRSVMHMDELVHAVACVDNVGLAWADLAERYERALIRRCRGEQDEIGATVLVRQVFAELRKRNFEPRSHLSPSLRDYVGTRPLRSWLSDRLHAARTAKAFGNRFELNPAARRNVLVRTGTFDSFDRVGCVAEYRSLRFPLAT